MTHESVGPIDLGEAGWKCYDETAISAARTRAVITGLRLVKLPEAAPGK